MVIGNTKPDGIGNGSASITLGAKVSLSHSGIASSSSNS
jgi:hypothetical protein